MTTSGSHCHDCGAQLDTGVAFCHRCGAVQPVPTPREGLAWVVAGGLVVLTLIVFLATQDRAAPVPLDMAAPAAGLSSRAPDISNLSSRQQFDRLYDRVMAAATEGDTATMIRLTEHALQVYAQLDSLDADARYHAAIMALQLGGAEAALVLADSILAADPAHLFGFLIRGTVAEISGDPRALQAAQAAFLGAWPSESARQRAEYLDHQAVLDQFRQAALVAGPRQP